MMVMFNLVKIFFCVGLFAFGGGTAMLPIIYQGVSVFGMSWSDFSDMVALAQITPGPIAVNAATYIGLQYAGIAGAIVATLAVCLPCFLVMLIVIKLIDRFKGSRIVEGAFVGIRPVTIGLILSAVIFVAGGVLVKGPVVSAQLADMDYYNWIPIGICAASMVLMSALKVKPIYVMLIMAAAGAVIYGVIL
ncbi:MAG: chromate transporter [Bacillota bacterium]|nr:chromate transporter [Bacillota bacterium]